MIMKWRNEINESNNNENERKIMKWRIIMK